MEDLKKIFQEKYKELGIPIPSLHFVLGSLMGSELEGCHKNSQWEKSGRLAFSEVPGLNPPSAPSHSGFYEYFYHKEKHKSICFQSGRLHGYEGLSAQEVVRTVTGPCQAGTNRFMLSNISGGLKTELVPGSVVAITDHINFTGKSPLVGLSKEKSKDFYFVDMEKAYDPEMTSSIVEEMKKQKLTVRSGVYMGVLGPQFETPAEVRLFAKWGADVVGMSTIWEVIALCYLKAKVGAFSIVANPACGVGKSVEINSSFLQPCFSSIIRSFFHFANKKV
ncbi:MAG: purine-nucleoside phosphorylase [Bdellovibrionales bacterium]|nr:purine-nucleoside phosphorylase [Bdellovibrionales bacterium]